MPCTKSELDLESMLPLQIGMVNVYLVQTSPKLGPDGGGPLEFQILSSGDDYQDLSHCYLYLKCQVLKANGLPIKSAKFTGWEATFGPMNLLFHCLFRQVDLVMNNIEIKLDKFNYMGRLLFLAGGYSCSWMVTNDPGVTLPPHSGRVSGTQGQRWWALLLLGTAGPPTPGV